MKTGNVIETGVRGGAVKESGRGSGAEKALSTAPKVAVKGRGAAAVDIAAQKFLSVAQVAKRWGVSDATVRRLIEEGELSGIKLRYARKLSIISVEAYETRAKF